MIEEHTEFVLQNENSKNVFLEKSNFSGVGLFAARAFEAGEVVCWFTGRALSKSDLKRPRSDEVNRAYSKYMIEFGDSLFCVPCDRNGKIPNFLPYRSGCFINEVGVTKNGHHIHPNVNVLNSPKFSKDINCLFSKDGEDLIVDLPVITVKNILKNEELFLDYGPFYKRDYQKSDYEFCKYRINLVERLGKLMYSLPCRPPDKVSMERI